jgi:hypothetical protein
MDSMSQSVGQLGGIASGGKVDSMNFMNEGAKQREGQDQLSKLDMTVPEDMTKASKIQLQMGNTELAIQLASEARKIQEEKRLRFETNQEDILANSARTQAMALAMKRKDRAAHAGLANNVIDAGVYLTSVHEEGVEAARAEVEREQGLVTYAEEKKIDAQYEPAKPASYSPHGKEAEDLGYAKGSPEYLDYVQKASAGTTSKISPESTQGKIAVDMGFIPGTPEFQAEVSRRTMADNPIAWNQYQSVLQSIRQDIRYQAAEEQGVKANQAMTFYREAEKGNSKAIPQLETSLATLLQSSVRAQAEIANIRASKDVAGRVLDSLSKGITGTLTASTLAQYGDAIQAVIRAAESEKGLVVNQLIDAAGNAGISTEVQTMTRDSFGVSPNSSNWSDRQ